jgi:DNA replication protein DnaC
METTAQQPQEQLPSQPASTPKPVEAIIQKIASTQIPWKTCAVCRQDYGILNDAGVCRGCETKNEEAAKQLAEEEQRREEFRKRSIALLGGVKAFETFHLENYRVSDGTRDAHQAIAKFNPEKDNLFLFGPTGLGKSHLATAAARRYISAQSLEAEVCNVEKLMRWFQMRDPREQEHRLDILAKRRVLVLDDIGVEKTSNFNLGILYDLINTRDMNGRNGLIITSNLDLQRLAVEKFGDDRVPSRINGLCRRIEMTGEDQRNKPSGR